MRGCEVPERPARVERLRAKASRTATLDRAPAFRFRRIQHHRTAGSGDSLGARTGILTGRSVDDALDDYGSRCVFHCGHGGWL